MMILHFPVLSLSFGTALSSLTKQGQVRAHTHTTHHIHTKPIDQDLFSFFGQTCRSNLIAGGTRGQLMEMRVLSGTTTVFLSSDYNEIQYVK